jgi:hypothetical protein
MISLVEDVHSGAALDMANNVLRQQQANCEYGSNMTNFMHTATAAMQQM